MAIAAAIAGCGSLTSCLDDDVDTIMAVPDDPAHAGATGNGKPGNGGDGQGGNQPGHGTIVGYEFSFYMAELRHPQTGEWLMLEGTNSKHQNAWVNIDGDMVEVEFVNADDPANDLTLKADIALLVDNSDSMEEENDAIAASVAEWTQRLSAAGVDARYAVIGHSEEGTINGATDFSGAANLVTFFNYMTGSKRSAHFGGTGGDRLQRAAAKYPRLSTECCMLALRFANDQLSFREDAERVFISFTDEPNQPYQNAEYSVEWLTKNWFAPMGEVHTIYSAEDTGLYTPLLVEPARMLSDLTGGTVTYTNESLSDVDLTRLEFSESLGHSYVAKLKDISKYMDTKTHLLVINVMSADGMVTASKTMRMMFE